MSTWVLLAVLCVVEHATVFSNDRAIGMKSMLQHNHAYPDVAAQILEHGATIEGNKKAN